MLRSSSLLLRSILRGSSESIPHQQHPSSLGGSSNNSSSSSSSSSSRGSGSSAAATVADIAADVALGMAQAGCLAYVVFNYFLSTCVMYGPSMSPTFQQEGDVVLVEKLSHKHGTLMPGDIVTCISPENPRQSICKRLVALEGMHVAVPLEDPDYPTSFLGVHRFTVHEVPRGHVWLLGDNTRVSHDSRSYGPVPYALLTGRVFAQVWPLERARMFAASHPPNPRQYAIDISTTSCR